MWAVENVNGDESLVKKEFETYQEAKAYAEWTLGTVCYEDPKIKVKSAEIVVHGTADRPYFEIKYYDIADGKCHIGYSSYSLNYVFDWLKECFEIVD